jgi:peptidoglycan/LPS O-acetylase OafA/YrhL
MGLLRLFLALSVVIHHLPQRSFAWLNAGVAVLVFFMISGFYMALIINERYSKADSWQLRFYLSRLGRLFPAYLTVLLLGLLWLAITTSPTVFTSNYSLGIWRQLLLIFSNIFIIGQDLFQTVLMTNAYGKHNVVSDTSVSLLGLEFFQNQFMVIGQSWSLAEELIFYALAPLFIRRVRSIVVVLAMSIAVRSLFQWQSTSFPPIVWGYWFFPSTISFFCLGALGYFGYKKVSCFSLAKTVGLILLGLWLSWVTFRLRNGGILYEGTDYDSINHWLFYICLATSIPFIFLATKDYYFDRLLGELSYPLYLVHGFIIGILLSRGGLSPGSFPAEAIIIVCSVGVASLMYVFVDGPVDHYRRHIETAPIAPMVRWTVTIFACILIVGLAAGIRAQWLTPIPPKAPEVPGLLGKPKIMPPVLVNVVGKFNIVRYKGQYFAIPHGQSVDWDKDNVPKLPGVLTASSQDEIRVMLPQ